MSPISLKLCGLLLATSALVAPGFAAAQDAPVTQPPAEAAQDETTQFEELVVRGRFIPETMRETSEVATVLLAEDLVRQGDDNVADAITRSSGLSLVGGRFVYVRGLGERYSSALLNGSPLPSPEPLQRVVPLDLFPSSILAGTVVQKTYSANYPGEFGGGVINIETVRAPGIPFFSMSVSAGGSWETTLGDGLTYYGSDTDWTGFDDGTRDMPDLLKSALRAGRGRISDATFEQTDLQRIGGSLINAPLNLLQRTKNVPGNFGIDLSAGRTIDLGWGDLGLIGVAGYDNSWKTRRGVQELGFLASSGELSANTHYDFESTQNDIGLNALFGATLGWGEHELKWTNLWIRSVTKEARSRTGVDFEEGIQDVRDDYTEWFERELLNTQLSGNYEFGNVGPGALELDARAAYATTSRETPYEKAIRYVLVGGQYIYGLNNKNSTSFGWVRDDLASGGVDLTYTMPLSDSRDLIVRGGWAISENDRFASQRIFQYQSTALPAGVQTERVDYLLADFNLQPGLFTFREVTGSSGAAAYEGVLDTNAFYLQGEAEIIPLVRVALGVRYEDATQTVTPIDLFGGAAPAAPAPLENEYWLPSGTLTWNFYDNMQLRLGGSKTIARPQFRELAPQQYLDPDTDRLFFGNPFLTDSELTNYDARWEWYFGRNQFFAVGAFYKGIDRPVEAIVNEGGGSAIQTTYINAPKAELYGAELEARRYFQSPWGDEWMRRVNWFVSGNYTYVNSKLKVDDTDVVFPLASNGLPTPALVYFEDGDQMQGQSDHLANLQFGFDDEEAGMQATILVNYASERISARGRPGFPDLVIKPGVTLDFTFRKSLDVMDREVEFGFEARNLLGTDFEETQTAGPNTIKVLTYEVGTSVSFSAKTKF